MGAGALVVRRAPHTGTRRQYRWYLFSTESLLGPRMNLIRIIREPSITGPPRSPPLGSPKYVLPRHHACPQTVLPITLIA